MTIKRMPVPQGFVADEDAGPRVNTPRRARYRALNASDGTNQLLVSGFGTMLVGVAAGLLTIFAFGGMGPQGAHSNAGWLSLMVAMMATPFAILLLLLGGAKWLRNYRISRGSLTL